MATTGFSLASKCSKTHQNKQRTHTFNSKGEGPEAVRSAVNRERKRPTEKALNHGAIFLNDLISKKGYSANVLSSRNALHWTAALGEKKQDQYLRDSGWSNKTSFRSIHHYPPLLILSFAVFAYFKNGYKHDTVYPSWSL